VELLYILNVVVGCLLGEYRFPLGVLSVAKVLLPLGSCHKRQKAQAPTPQAPIGNRQTRKVANAKVLNRNTNLT